MEAQVSTRPSDPSIVVDLERPEERKDFGVVPGLVWAFRIREDASAESLPTDQPIERHRGGGLWLHLNLTDVRATEWLNDRAPAHQRPTSCVDVRRIRA